MPRPVAVDDFMPVRLVSDPQIAPDGERVACVVTRIDRDKNKYFREIWVVPENPKAGEPRCFVGGEASHGLPRWSPDGKRLAFVSDRQKPKSQIYTIPVDGGEAQPLTKLETEGGIAAIHWSPDGSKIAFLFRATPAAYRKEATEERQKKEMPAPVRVHARLNYRLDGFGYYDGEYWQVWIADAQTGECKQLTQGDFNCQSLTWSPDSKTIAFLSNRDEYADLPGGTEDIWTVPAEGGEIARIPSPHGEKYGLAWSPNGEWFAYVGNPDPDDQWGTNNDRVFVLPATGSEEARDLTGKSDFAVGYLTLSDVHEAGAGDVAQWNASSDTLFFAASAQGDTRLFLLSINGGTPVPLSATGQEMGGFTISSNDRAAVTLGTPTTPRELVMLYAPNATDPFVRVVPLTHFNQEFSNEVQFVTPEPFVVAERPSGKVQGWILKPTDFQEGRKYPLVVYVHGGPHMQYGNILFHELQWLAAQGYVVCYTNPRGSKGYGEAHTRAIKGDWGGPDFEDIMAAADYACALSYVNLDKTAIMGGSYGGYMTAWAVGHTDRFACAITDRLVGDLVSMSGTDDFAWSHGTYFKGNAWDDPSDLWKHSPQAYAGSINTPLLIVHSDGDLRCPAGQAEELFAALRLQKKPVEYVRYPAESSHGMSRNGPPNLRLDRLQRNLAWLDKYLKA